MDRNILLKYATETETRYLQTYWEAETFRKAAKLLGVNKSTVQSAVKRVMDRAAKQGYAPDHDMTRTVPDGFHVKGVSTYYNKDGFPSGQWVKSSIDHERQMELMRSCVDALKEEIVPEAPAQAPAHTAEKLLNLYVITDYHLGAMSWQEETGANWDVKVASDLLINWFKTAISCSPQASVGVLANLGDFLHWDGLEAVTPTNRHVLDADTRFQKLVRIAINVIRRVVSILLQKHNFLYLLMAEGNHDIASSAWLRELFSAMYDNEPRIEVILSPDPYYCIEHGKTSLFFHHGHKCRLDTLETVFIAKFREVFGRTKHSYAHTGHLHHTHVKEKNTMIIEQHRTLTAPDSHSARGGWSSGRNAKCIIYHSDYGEVGSVSVSPDMVSDMQHASEDQ